MGSTIQTFDALTKERYIDSSRVQKLMYGDRPLFGLLEKKGDTGMIGSVTPVPIIYGLPQGLGGSFSTAQTNATNLTSVKFNVEAGDYFAVVHIGDKVLKATRTNPGAFLQNKFAEMDGLYEQAAEQLSIYTWGNGGGALGRRGSINTNTVTLSNPADASNFEIGMMVVASANDGSDAAHTLRSDGSTGIGVAEVTSVNVSAGTIEINAAANIDSFANGDYLFRESDFFGTTGTIVIKGLQCYITASDSPMALWGIQAATRATHPSRLAGCRVPSAAVSGKSFEERIRILGSYMTGRFKAKRPTAGFLHPEDWQVLETSLMSRGIRSLTDDNTQFGYRKIEWAGIPIYEDRHCPKGTFFALRMENFWLSSLGPVLAPQNEDGFEMLRRASSTDYEFRLISYPALICNAPLHGGRVSLG